MSELAGKSVFKQSILFLLLSTAALILKDQLAAGLHTILVMHNKIASWLGVVFSNDPTGQFIQAILALLVIPLVIGFGAALVFWLVKRSAMPYIMTTIWVVWTVLLVTMLAQIG